MPHATYHMPLVCTVKCILAKEVSMTEKNGCTYKAVTFLVTAIQLRLAVTSASFLDTGRAAL